MIIKRLKSISWYWVSTGVLLLIYFVVKGHNLGQVLYFITFLLPVVIGTSYYVNRKLIPEFLLRKKHALFSIYLIYTIIISLYLQYLIIFLALFIFTSFQLEHQSIITMNIGNLSLTLYLLVLLKVMIETIKKLSHKETIIASLQDKEEIASKAFGNKISIRHNRVNHTIRPSKIIYIESLSDYIKVVTEEDEILSKEKISKLIDRLPVYFKRTHRSFIINTQKITSYNRERITLGKHHIPISRTYKTAIIAYLNKY